MTATLPPAVTRAGSMRILLATHFFYPNIGGLETVARVLADEFTALGHEVVVVTQSPRPGGEGLDQQEFAYPVVRCPGRKELLRRVRWSEVYFQNNISLRTLWPLLLARRPWVVSHQTWLTRVDGRTGWEDRSQEIPHPLRLTHRHQPRGGRPAAGARDAHRQSVPGQTLPAAARRGAFQGDLVFLARLVSDKGGDMTLDALARMRSRRADATADRGR